MALKCCYCDFVWNPKVRQPRGCPNCKRYFTEKNQPEEVDIELTTEYIPQMKTFVMPETASKECQSPYKCGREILTGEKYAYMQDKVWCPDCIARYFLEAPKVVAPTLSFTDEILQEAQITESLQSLVESAYEIARRRYGEDFEKKLPKEDIQRICQSAWRQIRGELAPLY